MQIINRSHLYWKFDQNLYLSVGFWVTLITDQLINKHQQKHNHRCGGNELLQTDKMHCAMSCTAYHTIFFCATHLNDLPAWALPSVVRLFRAECEQLRSYNMLCRDNNIQTQPFATLTIQQLWWHSVLPVNGGGFVQQREWMSWFIGDDS